MLKGNVGFDLQGHETKVRMIDERQYVKVVMVDTGDMRRECQEFLHDLELWEKRCAGACDDEYEYEAEWEKNN